MNKNWQPLHLWMGTHFSSFQPPGWPLALLSDVYSFKWWILWGCSGLRTNLVPSNIFFWLYSSTFHSICCFQKSFSLLLEQSVRMHPYGIHYSFREHTDTHLIQYILYTHTHTDTQRHPISHTHKHRPYHTREHLPRPPACQGLVRG